MQRVFYRPIEAAIRWSGLVRYESRILATLGPRKLPEPDDFPRWPALRLNTERLFDAMANGDLPYGRCGITSDDPLLLDDPALTIRHVDLKAWMARFYPDQKPEFLFDALERHLHPSLNLDVVHILLAEHESLNLQLAERTRAWESLHAQHQVLNAEHKAALALKQQHREPGPRSHTTYLNIIAGLLTLMLSQSPSGRPYSSFSSQESIINALIAHFGNALGISQSTLENKFAEAKRRFHSG